MAKTEDSEVPAQNRPLLIMGLSGLFGALLAAGGFVLVHFMERSEESEAHARRIEARARKVEARAQEVEARARQVEAVLAEMRLNQDRYMKVLEATLNKQPTIVVAPASAPVPAAAPAAQPVPEVAVQAATPEKNEKIIATSETKHAEEGKKKETVRPECAAEKTPSAKLRGPILSGETVTRVLAVQQSHNRVMIDSGADSGLKPGMRFTVWRDGQYVAEVRLCSVLTRMSAGEITTASAEGIRIGDEVRAAQQCIATVGFEIHGS